MTRWQVRSGLALLSLVLGCAQTTPAKEPSIVGPAPLLETERRHLDSERIQADFSVLGVPVGAVEVRVCPKGDGRELSTVDTDMRAAALIRAVRRVGGRAHTTFTGDDVTPQRTEIDVYDGDKTRSYRVSYEPGAFDYEYTKTGDAAPKRGRKILETSALIHDVHSAFMLVRSWKPRLDEHAHFFVVLGRHLYRVDARSAGRKVVLIQGSPRVTTRIDGEARRVGPQGDASASTQRTFSLWFEDGGSSVPVQLTATTSYGDVTMTLTRHERSRDHCGAAPSPVLPP